MENCKKKTYLNLGPLFVFWMIWNERNARTFKEVEGENVNTGDR